MSERTETQAPMQRHDASLIAKTTDNAQQVTRITAIAATFPSQPPTQGKSSRNSSRWPAQHVSQHCTKLSIQYRFINLILLSTPPLQPTNPNHSLSKNLSTTQPSILHDICFTVCSETRGEQQGPALNEFLHASQSPYRTACSTLSPPGMP